MAMLPVMVATFDDGTVVTIEPKARDMVGAESSGHDFASGGQIRGMYAVAFACLHRMHRTGLLPEGVEPPADLQAFIDAVDLEAVAEDDPEGEG